MPCTKNILLCCIAFPYKVRLASKNCKTPLQFDAQWKLASKKSYYLI